MRSVPGHRVLPVVLRCSTARSRARRSSPACISSTSCCCPAILVGLFTAHIGLVFVHKHTQFPGPGRTNENVVGFPVMPVYAAKAGGFFFIVFGVIALISALVTINPIWAYGPYDPSPVTAGSQPDWYMGFADGALRLLPGWLEFSAFGFTFSLQRHDRRHPADPGDVRPDRPSTRSSSSGSPATTASTTCSTGRATTRPAPGWAWRAMTDLRRADVRRRQRHHGDQAGPVDQRHHPLPAGGLLHRPAHRVLGHQADLPVSCSAATATWSCTAARPAASSAPPRAGSSSSTSRSTSTPAGTSCSTSSTSRCSSRPGPTSTAWPLPTRARSGSAAKVSHFYFNDRVEPVTPAELAAAHHDGRHAEEIEQQEPGGAPLVEVAPSGSAETPDAAGRHRH